MVGWFDLVNHFDNRYSSPSIEGRRCSLPSVTRFIVFNTMCQLKSTSLVCHKAEILVVCKKRWKLFSCMRLPVLLHLNICLNPSTSSWAVSYSWSATATYSWARSRILPRTKSRAWAVSVILSIFSIEFQQVAIMWIGIGVPEYTIMLLN